MVLAVVLRKETPASMLLNAMTDGMPAVYTITALGFIKPEAERPSIVSPFVKFFTNPGLGISAADTNLSSKISLLIITKHCTIIH